MITEDLGAFLADFGVACIAGAQQFVGLLDEPDELLTFERSSAHSRQTVLTYITDAAALARGDAVSVAGTAYTVREASRQQGDGAFSTVLLTRT